MTTEEINKLERKSREELLKRLEYPRKLLEKAAAKRVNERKEKFARFTRFADEKEAQEAYGWGMITEKEYDELCDLFRKGEEEIENERSVEECALEMLESFMRTIKTQCVEFRDSEPDTMPRIYSEVVKR